MGTSSVPNVTVDGLSFYRFLKSRVKPPKIRETLPLLFVRDNSQLTPGFLDLAK